VITTDISEKYTSDSEEKILIRKINDLITKSRKEYSVTYSHFLDPAQQSLLSRIEEFYGYISFEGGYEDAERRLCRICTDEYCTDNGAPIVLLKAVIPARSGEPTHREILGSIMGTGIKREMVGDILPNKNEPVFFCHSLSAQHLELELKKIGRANAEISRCTLTDIPEPKLKEKQINVSSMRLDCIAAEGFGMSRSKAAEYIKKGVVAVNWIITPDPSKEIKTGDKISLRGKGKIRIGEISGLSKKGRIFLKIYS